MSPEELDINKQYGIRLTLEKEGFLNNSHEHKAAYIFFGEIQGSPLTVRALIYEKTAKREKLWQGSTVHQSGKKQPLVTV